jgi:acyl transferase domain-containing protein/thioesterase domain-containing protein/acyl carrier protein
MTDLGERLAGLTPAKRQLLEQRLRSETRVAEPVAIVGMACRFPGAADLDAFWRLIRDGLDATGPIPSSRWDVDALFDPTGEQPGKMSVRCAGLVDDVDKFDPQFFGISPREASRMDPQQRLLLEVAWEALEVAGLAPERMGGTATGVFVGIGGTDYSKIPAQFEDYYQHIDAHVGTGNALSIASNRVSYILDLHGPSLSVDTACSSGLLGVHLAVQCLRNRECDAALAGGVNLILSPETTIAFSKARMLSPDGLCRPFDAGANGYVRGEGCGILVLKRLTDAVRDGDRVLAVIRGTAANQDGRTSGITAPSGRAQQAVIRAAIAQAGLTTDRISYIEAHGTGTPLGDPIETQALAEVFRRRTDQDPPLHIASVKANIGHTETVSGIAGIIKVVLMLQHHSIPAQLHLQTLNPHLGLEGSRLQIPREATVWQPAGATRVAGVSSFGFGGTNTHIVLEEASPPVPAPAPSADRPLHLLALSAKTEAALAKLAARYADYLDRQPQASAADVCYNANIGRSHFNHRAILTARDTGELSDRLLALRDGTKPAGVKAGRAKLVTLPKVAFLFTGQGAQYAGMGRSLFETQPAFRKTLQQCDEILRDCLQQPLLQVLYGNAGQTALLDETAYTQPALFALEYSLARLWQSWGIEPSALIGHSVGEYVAACVAGVFSLEDGLRLIATRAALMQQLPQDGLMAVIFAPPQRVERQLEPFRDSVSVAAANGPENTVISGAAEAIRSLVEQFSRDGVGTQLLTVSHAFHSPLMEPMLDPFQAAASRFQYQPAQIPLVSNLTGRLIGDEPLDATYWRRHIRSPVQFGQGMRTLADQGLHAMLEVGPTASLLGMGRRCLPDLQVLWLPSLRKGQEDWPNLLASLSELYVLGAKVDWPGFDRGYPRQRLILPTYPFENERYWFEPTKSPRAPLTASQGPVLHPLLGNRVPSALPTQLFAARLSCHWPKYLIDHQVQGSPVFPAAGYVEQALAAAEQVFGPGPHVLENLSIQHAMFLPEASARAVQIAVSPESGGACSLETYSMPAEGEAVEARWSLHAAGAVRRGQTVPPADAAVVDLDEVRGRSITTHMHDEFYQDIMHNRGLVYGPAFQAIQNVYHTSVDALAEVRLPAAVQAELAGYHLHPALGDAMFQASSGMVPLEEDGSYSPYTYMPMGARRVRLLGPVSEGRYAYAVRRSLDNRPSPESVEGDVLLVDDQGRVLVEMLGIRLQRVGRGRTAQRESDLQQWLYQVGWEPVPLRPQAPATRTGRWLIFADQHGVAQQLATDLRQATGQACVLVHPGDGFRALSSHGEDREPGAYQIDPLAADDYERLLTDTFGDEDAVCAGVVHLWSLDIADPDDATPAEWAETRRLGCGSVLQLVRQLARFHFAKMPGVWLATQGAQAVTGEPAGVAVAQAPVWGLGRVAELEHPELACRLVDFDPAADVATVAAQLQQELAGPDANDQVAYRGERRLAARLRRAAEVLSDAAPAGSPGRLAVPAAGPFRLRLGAAGSFDALRYESCVRPSPQPGQVEIRVHATGLNFSDILKAMGLYPGITDEIVPLGIECAGVVTALGAGVQRFRVGDAVLGVVPYSLASHAVTAEYALMPKPPRVTDAEAATIPITFLTAYYGLVRLAHLQPGERVLIHAAAGGVGLAAIQIAQQIGAEVFATAGSDAKRDFLRSLGVQHVFSSRTLDFADEILQATDRQGVDVVLNSLPGDAIGKSLSLLRAYGRFLEIGKTDIYQNRMIGLLPFQDNLSYFAIDLDRLLRQRPDTVRELFAEVMQLVERGVYRPLPLTEFAAEQTAEAFRYMAQRKNIGKVVVRIGDAAAGAKPEKAESETPAAAADSGAALVRADGTYLITGGLGALGQQLTAWLAAQGARHLALLSRRDPPPPVAARLDQLRAQGIAVAVLRGDAADRRSLAEALAQLPQDFPPLRGVIHAAGVLEDGLLFDMSLEQLERPMAPKVQGAWNLHAATRDAPLDFFVLFSSVASVLGSPGQANYAAGNAFLDALAAWRRSQGLPALSVNWGPWAESGMAAEAGRAEQLQSRGMDLLPPPRALELLGTLLRHAPGNVTVMDAQWSAMLRRMGGRVPPLFGEIAAQESEGEPKPAADAVDQAFRHELLAVDADRRTAMLREYFADELCRIMGIERPQLDLEQPLNEIGMDSLLAMELKTNLELRLAFTLPMAAFLERPSVTTLAGHAAKALVAGAEEAALETEAVRVADLASWSPLVCLQPAGEGPPLFCVHPLGGDVNCYRDFARQFQGRPVYALRGRGNEGIFPPHAAMPEMVAAYLEAIRAVQPRGPYYLTSWSAGGIFSYALARALHERGEPLGLVMLFDTPLPSIYDSVSLDDDVKFLFDLGKFANWFSGSDIDVDKLSYDELRKMDDSTRWEFALQIAKTHGALPPDTSTDHIRRVVEAAMSHARMIHDYQIAAFDQAVHLVRPEQPDVLSRMTGQTLGPDLGWGDVIGDWLRLHTAPGDHFSMIQAANAAPLAELVNACR